MSEPHIRAPERRAASTLRNASGCSAELAALADGLAAHAGEVLERISERSITACAPLPEQTRGGLAQVCVLTTVALARWIGGDAPERALVAAREAWELLEELAAGGALTSAEVSERCLLWREAVEDVLHARASEIGASPAALAKAVSLTRAALAVTLAQTRDAFAHSSGGEARPIPYEPSMAAPAVTRDPVTGLPNRALVLDRGAQMIGRARRSGLLVGALLIELDSLPEVAAEHGADAGEELVRRVAARIDDVARGADTIGRVSASRFVVLAEADDTAETVIAICERVRGALSAPFNLARDPREPSGALELTTPASIAFAVGLPTDPATLIAEAETAMEAARRREGSRGTAVARTGAAQPAAG
jgi:diguanylate cyclase (GGDEF)-like protein